MIVVETGDKIVPQIVYSSFELVAELPEGKITRKAFTELEYRGLKYEFKNLENTLRELYTTFHSYNDRCFSYRQPDGKESIVRLTGFVSNNQNAHSEK